MAQFVLVIVAWSALMGCLFTLITQGTIWWAGLSASICFVIASMALTTLQRWQRARQHQAGSE